MYTAIRWQEALRIEQMKTSCTQDLLASYEGAASNLHNYP